MGLERSRCVELPDSQRDFSWQGGDNSPFNVKSLDVSSPVYISGCRCIFQCTRKNSDACEWLKKKMLDRCKG